MYLAVQVRQDTRALRSSTFRDISQQMAQNVEPIVANADVADVVTKGLGGLAGLTAGERLRFQSMLVMSFRRMEAVWIHAQLGAMDQELARGFEHAMLSILQSPGAAEWWKPAKVTINASFSSHVDQWLASREAQGIHPSMGVPLD